MAFGGVTMGLYVVFMVYEKQYNCNYYHGVICIEIRSECKKWC